MTCPVIVTHVYVRSEPIEAETTPIPEPPVEPEVTFAFPEPPQQVTADTSKDDNDNDWLARMEAQ